jgi:hypothetical protein
MTTLDMAVFSKTDLGSTPCKKLKETLHPKNTVIIYETPMFKKDSHVQCLHENALDKTLYVKDDGVPFASVTREISKPDTPSKQIDTVQVPSFIENEAIKKLKSLSKAKDGEVKWFFVLNLKFLEPVSIVSLLERIPVDAHCIQDVFWLLEDCLVVFVVEEVPGILASTLVQVLDWNVSDKATPDISSLSFDNMIPLEKELFKQGVLNVSRFLVKMRFLKKNERLFNGTMLLACNLGYSFAISTQETFNEIVRRANTFPGERSDFLKNTLEEPIIFNENRVQVFPKRENDKTVSGSLCLDEDYFSADGLNQPPQMLTEDEMTLYLTEAKRSTSAWKDFY